MNLYRLIRAGSFFGGQKAMALFAKDEAEARKIAHRFDTSPFRGDGKQWCWLDDEHTGCELIAENCTVIADLSHGFVLRV